MTFPHGDTSQRPAPADPRFEECADCGHFPNWHARGSRRPLPWLGLVICQAWDPDGVDHKCRCKAWRPKSTRAAVAA